MPPLSVRRASLVACLSAATVLGTVAATALAPAANAATTITVAADGSGNYTTVQAAIAAASSGTVISIKAGTYYGQVAIASGKSGITLRGATGAATDIVITGSVPQSTAGASGSATVLNLAKNTTITGLTIANTYAAHDSQALALYAGGDRQVYRNVRLIG